MRHIAIGICYKAAVAFFAALILCSCNSTPTANTASSANAATSPATSNEPVRTVTIDSADGLEIVGTYYAAPKPNSPAVLMLHQWQSDRHSYDEFAKREQGKGFAVLTIDGRGFGESTKKADGSTVAAGRTDADVKAMLGDVDAAVNFIKKQPNVDPARIGIVGASYGSSLAIIYAADHPEIKTVALLSPGLNYFGNMPTRPAVDKYGPDRDLFIISSPGDTESAEAARALGGTVRHGFMNLPVGNAHGTDMFKYRDKLNGPPVVEDGLEGFLMTRMGLAKADYN